MKCTIVIVSYNTKELTRNCLKSILTKKWENEFEVVISDNNSLDGTTELIKKEFPKIKVIKNKENLGFSKGCNIVLKQTKSPFYLLLNSDTIVLDSSLDNLLKFMQENNYHIASCKLLNTDKTLQPNAGDLPTFLPVFKALCIKRADHLGAWLFSTQPELNPSRQN